MGRLYQWVLEDPQTRIGIMAAAIGVGGVVLGALLNSLVLPWVRSFAERLMEKTENRFSKKKFEYRYLDWVISEHENLRLLPNMLTPAAQASPQELDKLYLSLAVTADGEKQAEMQLGEALKGNSKLVILGEPGAGKTTTLQFLALTFALARRRRSPAKAAAERRRQEQKIRAARRRVREEYGYDDYPLPVFVFLNRLGGIAGWPPGRGILDAVRDEWRENELLRGIPADFFEEKLSRGECVFLLDAFDELGSQSARDAVAYHIGGLAATAQQGNRFVVTSRIYGYGGQLSRYGFNVLKVQRLSQELVKQLVTKWYDALGKKELGGELLRTLRRNPKVAALAVNPMLLSLIVLVQYVHRLIPDRRHLLYQDCVKILVGRSYAPQEVQAAYDQTLPGDEATQVLQELAARMHRAHLREVPRDELEAELIPEILRGMEGSAAARVPPADIVRNIEERSQLLVERGFNEQRASIMAFSHLTFQEYLASVVYTGLIADKGEEAVSAEVVERYVSDREWWEEVALLYAAQLKTQQRESFLRRLLPEPADRGASAGGPVPEKLLRLRLAARSLIEWKEPPDSERYRRVVADLLAEHPFAARAGFRLDAPWVRLDSHGFVLWFLSETLEAADTPPLWERVDEADAHRSISRFRMMQPRRLLEYLLRQPNQPAELTHGFTVYDILYYLEGYLNFRKGEANSLHVDIALAGMLCEEEGKQREWMKFLVKSIIKSSPLNFQERSFLLKLYDAVTRTRPRLFLVLLLLASPPVLLLTRGLPLSWAVTAALSAALVVGVATPGLYKILRRAYVRRVLQEPMEPAIGKLEGLADARQYVILLEERCWLRPDLFSAILKDERFGVPPMEFLSLFYTASGEVVREGIAMLADRETSMPLRVAVFGWLCRVWIINDEQVGVSSLIYSRQPSELEL